MHFKADILNYENIYYACSSGDIFSYAKKGKGNKSFDKKMIGCVINSGYKTVVLTKDKKKNSFLLHRLIAQTFIPNPENKPCVKHKDGNKLNNCIENLEWVTHKENSMHGWANGLCKITDKDIKRRIETGKRDGFTDGLKKYQNENRKVNFRILSEWIKRHNLGESYSSIARDYNVSYRCVSLYINKKLIPIN